MTFTGDYAAVNEQQDLNKKEIVYPRRNVKTQYTRDKKTISLSNRYDVSNDYETSSLHEHSNYDVTQTYIHGPNPQQRRKKRTVTILGDSMIKDVKSHKMRSWKW